MRFPTPRVPGWQRRAAAPALALVLLAALACGDADPEAKLEAAGRALTDARAEVQEAQERVESRKQALEVAEQELEEARKQLRGAEKKLAEVETRIDLRATDAALFRAVQSRLLKDEKLERVAVAARVEKGVVTLTGQVPDAKLRERAAEITRATPGVAAVENRIQVGTPPQPTAQ